MKIKSIWYLEAPFHLKDYFNALNLRCVVRLYGDHGLDMMLKTVTNRLIIAVST
ncbi:hypothetical protein Pint_19373 [Pistacia integerrima]|uniref:Uncharacterized protein n=1 Tax=Pistacia integerrima TaxID=434235 RepID=A0ACC0YXK6_9ROSI|nr:hypothetical protein Pint_19373 [Pistacia integerrima]